VNQVGGQATSGSGTKETEKQPDQSKPDSSSTTRETTDGDKPSESVASGDKPAGESTPRGEIADAGDKVTPEEKSQPENKPQDVYVMGSPNRNVYSQPESWETTGPSDGEYRPHFRSGGMNIENIEMTDADKMPITVGVGPIVMEEGAKAKEVLAEKEQRFMVGVLSDIAELPVSDVLKSEVEVVSGGVKTSRLKGSEAEAKVTALLEQAENELSNKLLVLETQKSALIGDIATLEKKASANAEAQVQV
jgi:hypothetical protein